MRRAICVQTWLDSGFRLVIEMAPMVRNRLADGAMIVMPQSPLGEPVDGPSPWWTPARHTDRKPFLMARGAITRAIRAWFDEQGFSEVETGILQVSPGNETHLHAPRTELWRTDDRRATRYLRKFYPWYLQRLALEPPVAKELQSALHAADSVAHARRLLDTLRTPRTAAHESLVAAV